MPQVAFTYKDGIGLGKKPERPPRRPAASTPRPPAAATVVQAPVQAPSLSEKEYLSNIDLGYKITGNAPWKPLNVYNDGIRTYIRMPGVSAMPTATAPSLLVISADGSSTVSYFRDGDTYVVDSLFDNGLLVAGTEPNQTSVTIERERR